MPRKKKPKPKKPLKFSSKTIRIRMYRIGFGDCFLVSLPVPNSDPNADTHRHVLVDCGVHAKGKLDMSDKAVDDIATTTRKRLAVIIATHSHQDHISGFDKKKFTGFEIGEVWMPWCENPKDTKALKLQKRHAALTEKLDGHFKAERRNGARPDRSRLSAEAAIANLVQNKTAMTFLRSGFGVNAQVRYLEAGYSLKNPAGIEGLSVNVLGPPRDEKFLAMMNPPAGQRYLKAGAASSENADELQPFADRWKREATHPEISHLGLSDDDTELFQEELASPSLDSLAFALDQAKNNTSLVTLLTFRGQQLLFTGDAQWGNWKFWLDQPDAESILSGVSFLKVAHHGSHNATPKDALEKMSKGKFAAMVSTQSVPWDSIPRIPLMDRLGEQTKNRVVRSDSLPLQGAPNGPPTDVSQLKGFVQGDFWYDYLIKL
jgi:hypothetical protein